MKRISALLLIAVLIISMSVPAFAAESEKEIDVIGKYISDIEGEYKTTLQNGGASVNADGTTVSVTGAPKEAKTLVVVPIPSSINEAYEWFSECLETIGKPLAAYEIYFLDADGNQISADGANIHISCPNGKTLTVLSLSAGGSYTDLSAEIKDGAAAFTANNGDYFIITEKKSTEPKPDGNVTVPVRGDENEIHADVTLDGDTVELHELDFAEIDHIIGDKDKDGLIEIDLTKLDEEIKKIELPMASIKHIVEAAEETHNEHEHLQIDFPHGSVTLDDKTLRAIIDTVGEETTVELVLESVGTDRLNDTQDKALEGTKVYGGYEAYLVCNNTGVRVSDFKGGVATLSVPFEIPNGLKAEKFAVWYVADDGKTEKLDTRYENEHLVWDVGHFSDFIIVYEGEETPDVPVTPPTGDDTMIWLWILVVIVTICVIFFLLIFWKRRRKANG